MSSLCYKNSLLRSYGFRVASIYFYGTSESAMSIIQINIRKLNLNLLYKTQKQSVHLSAQPHVYPSIILLTRYLCVTVIDNSLQSTILPQNMAWH